MNKNLIEQLVLIQLHNATTEDYLRKSSFFDERIMLHQRTALGVWKSVANRFAAKEKKFGIPYTLAETPKLYAVDALTIAEPLIRNTSDLFHIAELFTIFYVMVHYFDDHVEHRDKFYSKFSFDLQTNTDTQHGAAPFSFILISLEVISEVLDEISSLNANAKLAIFHIIHSALALQTRYFASERNLNLTPEEVLEMKQRQVSGQTLSILADIIGYLPASREYGIDNLKQGLLYLGSLTQITDDIRDMNIDATLHNANIVNACIEQKGLESGLPALSDIYSSEVDRATSHLDAYSKDELSVVMSLPFYPFMVDKTRLRSTEL